MTSKPTETELLPERRHFEVNRGSNGWMVGYFEGVHFKKVAKFYQREALDRFLALPECPTCAYTVDDLARTPSPTPTSAEARARARELVDEWRNTWRGMSDACMTANRIDLIDRIARLSTPQPTLQQAIDCVRRAHSSYGGSANQDYDYGFHDAFEQAITALESLASTDDDIKAAEAFAERAWNGNS